jgi:predicted phage terminase large subunit-like protein
MARDKTPISDPIAIDPHIPLIDFIPKVTEGLMRPYHLAEYCDALDRLPFTSTRLVTDAPRRHTKSTTTHHAAAKWLLLYPKLQIIYYTYGLAFAYENNRLINAIYRRAGGRIGDRDTQAHWTTPEGGGVFATSRDGSLVGRGGDIAIIDDPFKNRAEAEEPSMRDMIDSAIRNDLIPCLKKNSPVVWVASRYHEDDASGRALKRGAQHIHYKAISTTDGVDAALWPEERPLEYLYALREEIGEYAFASNYQGEPQPPASQLFAGLHTYTPDGLQPLRIVIGVDLAFSRRGDYTALVVLGDFGDHYRVIDVVRGQWTVDRVRAELIAMMLRYPTHDGFGSLYEDRRKARYVAYVSGPEAGVYDLLLEHGVSIERIPARYSKLQRAQRTSQGWIRGRVRLPSESLRWVDPFVSEVRYFSGIDDAHDDQVDALCAAFDAAEGARSTAGFAPGSMIGDRCF